MTTTAEEILYERVAPQATELLAALQPWEAHGPEVRSAAARLTVTLAALPESPAESKDCTCQPGLSAAFMEGCPVHDA